MARRTAGLLVFLGALQWVAWAQAPVGSEFQVNTYTPNGQAQPSVAADANGNFVVVWRNEVQPFVFDGPFGQRFDAAGAAVGAEFRVGTTGGPQPAVAADPSGRFVVVWSAAGDIFGQRFSAAGAQMGSEFRVNAFSTGGQFAPSITSDANGNFVVVWVSLAQPEDEYLGIFGQRFSAAGAPMGGEFHVNTYTTNRQVNPSVASDARGNFVVVWDSVRQEGSGYGVFAQRFSADGTLRGDEFRVNTNTTSPQMFSSVAGDASGNFIVVWEQMVLPQILFDGPFGQRFDSSGVPVGAEFRVPPFTKALLFPMQPTVAMAPGGGFVVTWKSDNALDGSGQGVLGRLFSVAGVPSGAEFRVNSYTTGNQSYSAVASDGSGNYVVAWVSGGQDGSADGIFGQRFGGLHSRALAVDPAAANGSDGNGILEPGEAVSVRPSWQSFTGDKLLSVGSEASTFTGPAGAAYTVADAVGLYQLPDAATMPCVDCFELGVSVPSARPATHWDASFLESMAPPHGQQKAWALHVGDSFSDVSRGSLFYSFIETLLHHSVTGGCEPGQYCPESPATRAQMAVFVLVADEGGSFAPPACVAGNEVFGDLPAASSFCPWVEELSRRGVVDGCQASPPLYCPEDAVTRAQMAVFVLATREPGFTPPDCVSGSEVFGDVPAGNVFCRWIEELSRRGVVSGCAPGLYCPDDPVTRGQMGVFISGTFGLTLYGP
jgi:hypothetical protein